jgi:3-dehydrosphinganine reductase
VEAAAPVVLEGLGGLDLLINNAGVACVAPISEAAPEDYERMMAINYFGTVWTTRAFLDHFVGQGSGTILCVASTLGAMGLYGYTAYSASKFAVMGFCDSLRQDLLKHGVRVSVLIPADVDTPQLRGNAPHKPPETKALAGAANLVTPEFIATETLDGLEHEHRYLIIPGRANRTILWLNRVAPGVVRAYINGQLRKFWRQT